MKAFVTGSTGLLGSNLVHQLVAAGWEVKAMARSISKAQKLLGELEIEIVEGDMENIAGFAEHLNDCDVLFHTAAYFREYFGSGTADEHWQKLMQINIEGTISLLREAETRGLKKAIYVSSSTVIGKRADGSPADESTQPDQAFISNQLYAKSKVVAEERIAEFLKTSSLPVVLILPSAIFGPGDAAPTASGRMLLDAVHGELPAIPPGGFEMIDARDVADAMITAVEKGRSGERYIINNRYASIAEVFRVITEVTGTATPRLPLPYPMAMTYAWVSEQWARITGTEPLATVAAIQTLTRRFPVSSAKARRELDLNPRSLEDTIRDEMQWYVDHGYLKKTLPRLEPALAS